MLPQTLAPLEGYAAHPRPRIAGATAKAGLLFGGCARHPIRRHALGAAVHGACCDHIRQVIVRGAPKAPMSGSLRSTPNLPAHLAQAVFVIMAQSALKPSPRNPDTALRNSGGLNRNATPQLERCGLGPKKTALDGLPKSANLASLRNREEPVLLAALTDKGTGASRMEARCTDCRAAEFTYTDRA